MPTCKFIPNGSLDVNSNASLLPADSSQDGKLILSGALRRCTNMRIDEEGIARTRYGSTRGSTALSHAANCMIELAGKRYEFGGDEIYEDEVSIDSGLTSANWSATITRAYNGDTDCIFALNGTDRKRIEDGMTHEWGADIPPTVLQTTSNFNFSYIYDWEGAYSIPVTTETSTLFNGCESTSGWTLSNAGDYSFSLSASTTCKEGTYSIKGNWPYPYVSTNFSPYYVRYDAGAGGTNLSSYGSISFWFRRDGSKTSTVALRLTDTSGAIVSADISVPAEDTWSWNKIAKTSFDAISGSFNWAAVRYFEVRRTYTSAPGQSIAHFVDAFYGHTSTTENITNGCKFCETYTDDTVGQYEYTYSWEDDHLDDAELVPIGNRNKVVMRFWEFGTAYINPQIYLRYTYCRKDGSTLIYESNPSDVTSVRVKTAVIMFWDAPSDPDITHVRIYRTPINGTGYYFDSEWPVTSSGASLTSHDDDLGTIVEENNDRPPLGSLVSGPVFGCLFVAQDNLLYFSKGNQPECWPALYYVEVSPPHQPLKALCVWGGTVYAFSEFKVYQIQGTNHSSFFPLEMNCLTGAKNQNAILPIPDAGILHIGNDGVYLWTPTSDMNITNQAFGCLFRATNGENVPYVYETYLSRCFSLRYKDKVYFFYPESTDTYPSNVLVFDLKANRVVHHEYAQQFVSGCVDYTNDRLYVCDSSGYIWQLVNESATTDNSTAITWQIQSKTFADSLYKYFPRRAKYDVNIGTSATAQGDVLLNETSKQTHTLTGSRDTKTRLVTGCTGDRLAIRISGTGTVAVYGAEIE